MKQIYKSYSVMRSWIIVLLLLCSLNALAQGSETNPSSTEAMRAELRKLREKHLRPGSNTTANQQHWQRAQQKYGRARDSLFNAAFSKQLEIRVREQQAKDREELHSLQLMSTTSTGEGLVPDAVERQALVDIYNATNGAGWWNSTNWLVGNTSADFGDWYGVDVLNGDVMYLNLSNNNLNGSIPASIGNLTGLYNLILGSNNLTGQIPATIGNLTSLQGLYLYNTQLSGSIPNELGQLTELHTIYLQNNKLTGQIPASLGNLVKLRVFYLTRNQLSGPIPGTLGNLTALYELGLDNNNLSGPIPPELGNLGVLQTLYIHSNALTGTIPPQLGSMWPISRLYMHNNMLSGSIPTELGNLTNLQELGIGGNNLSGPIPASFANLINLSQLYANNSNLSGPIPAFLGGYTYAKYLYLDQNNFTGELPASLGNLAHLVDFSVWGNQLSGAVPASFASLPSLEYLSLEGNTISSIPNFQGAPRYYTLYIHTDGNKLDFGSIEPNMSGAGTSALAGFYYTNQALIGSPRTVDLTVGQPLELSFATGGTRNTYQWQKQVNGAWQDIAGATGISYTVPSATLADAGVYRCRITNAWATALTLYTHEMTVQEAQVQNMNHIITTTLQDAYQALPDLQSLPKEKWQQQITYFDGLGRPIQQVQRHASPAGKDIVVPMVYDPMGREHKKYLPYVATGSNGFYQTDALDRVRDFYMATGDRVANDTVPYSRTIFENSPLNRISEQGAAGDAWKPGTGRTIKLAERTNVADEVRLWQYDWATGELTSQASKQLTAAYAVFNGSYAHVQVGDRSQLKLSNTFTLEAWINPVATTYGTILSKEGEYIMGIAPDGIIRWGFANTNPGWHWLHTGVVAPVGTWSHVAVSYDSGVVKTYLNGVLVHTYNGSGTVGDAITSLNDFRIGGRQADYESLKGAIDEVRVWNTVRTQQQISGSMAQTLTAPVAGLVGYWSLNEGGGTTTADGSGNNLTGTLVNQTVLTGSPFYSPSQLYVTETRDEHDALVVEYKDKQGRVVMKKVQEAATVTDSKTATGFMVTQYVYDEKGQLRLVMQPEGSMAVPTTGSFTITKSDAFNTSWCFRYDYDGRGRMTRKQVPGSGAVEMVYNKRDLPVLTQDAVQQAKSEWSFTKYDALNRPVMTGTVVISNKTRSDLETELDAETVHFESDDLNSDAGYTLNNAYPRNLTTDNLLSVTYYDKYTYSALTASTYAFTGDVAKRAAAVRGQVTGTKVRRMEGLTKGDWLVSATYYDKEYRPLENISDSHLGDRDRMVSVYDFTGKVTQTTLTHRYGTTVARTVINTFAYDHTGRATTTTQQMDTEPEVLLSKAEYNELGQLVDKKLHSTDTGASFLQSVDYRYNIRGWMTSINNAALTSDNGGTNDETDDMFGMELSYDRDLKLWGTAQFNGNISEVLWRSYTNNTQRGYSYGYDKASRLSNASYYTAATNGENYSVEMFSRDANGNPVAGSGYDSNGNIKSMSRRSITGGDIYGHASQKTYGEVDRLSYYYEGNRLVGVDDASGEVGPAGDFRDNGNKYWASNVIEYEYDANGNLTKDKNKGISHVFYNHLNLPYKVEMAGGSIEFTYTATGQKLQKKVTQGTTFTYTDYAGGFVYENSTPVFAHTSEGRVLYQPGNTYAWKYEYHIKDHLGNLRLTFKDGEMNSQMLTMEQVNAEEEENEFERVPQSRRRDRIHARTGEHAARLNARQGLLLGPSKRLEVKRGDKLEVEVFGHYQQEVKDNWLYSLAAFLVGSTTVQATEQTSEGVSTTSKSKFPLLALGIAFTPQIKQALQGVPTAYVKYVAYDTAGAYIGSEYRLVTREAQNNWQQLKLEHKARQDGYVEVFLANESGEDVYFDDMMISSTPLDVQENHYDPWGLNLAGIERQGAPDHLFQYNGKEKQTELGLNWMDYGARMYDAQIGRYHVKDRFAEKYYSLTPYQYGGNNPILFNDINGDSLWISHKGNQILYENGNLYNKNGTAYTGAGVKTDKNGNVTGYKGFLKQTVNALNSIAGTKDGAPVISELQSSANSFTIVDAQFNPNGAGVNEFAADNRGAAFATAILDANQGQAQPGGSGGTVYWNPNGPSLPEAGGGMGFRRETNLAHELFHGYEANRGWLDNRPINGLARDEWRASYFENQVRNQLGYPYRSHYNTRANGAINLLNNNVPVNVPPPSIWWLQYIRFR